ncbi:hypothetical protein FSP39_024202 [Pinctada imbricata]|uniref:C2H2-type domain-containing protein n=1 Tax=Pinctada imbricata TaxID=66713 RepID=A0AA88Y1K3_PINIB|nr:hypothetical protein FSP39_024202 [Pinctada imbricata]
MLDSPTKVYRCRLCSFNTSTYTQLQLHMPKHGGVKALKCPMCDYSTNDKSNFRRHRRLHMGNNPVSVFKCGKCSFSTIMLRKFKEHCSQVHNEDLLHVPNSHVSHMTFAPPTYTDGVDRTLTLNPPLDLQHPSHHQSSLHGNFSASNALHSLLTGIHPPAPLYRRQTYPAQSIGQYGTYLPPMGQVNEENHMASNYLRSIVSSIMNTHPPPRIPPSSTITSSNYYLSSAQREPHLSSSTHTAMMSDLQSRVKVKVEPPERDSTPDVSSSALPVHPHVLNKPSATLNVHPYSRRFSDPSHSINTAEGNEASQSLEMVRPNSTESEQSYRQEPRSSVDNTVNTTVKSELVSVGIQCSVQRMKMETDINRNHSIFGSNVDQGVQCELITATGRRTQRSLSVTSESGSSEQQGNRCIHCGVTFDDEVLYSIHIGCHSHTDPFVCNVCGKQCGNKYGFYSHIMRGHHY